MPTALELSREQWQPYIEAAQRRRAPAKPTLANQKDREQLLERVRQVAAELKTRFKAKRVILFGSLVDVAWFTSDSDVDLAVEGLAATDYWQAWRLAEEIIDIRPVDLIELESAKDSLRRAILRYGIDL